MPDAEITLRHPAPGDMSWLVLRHMQTIAREQGWNARYEGHLLKISARYLLELDPTCERAWVAARGEEVLGCIGLVRDDGDDTVARLRMLYVDTAARGLGLGKRLVNECLGFARDKGYLAVELWTLDVLVAARAIYAAAGFRLVRSQAWDDIGPVLQDEVWRLDF